MTQAKPAIDPIMFAPVPEEARGYFGAALRQELARQLHAAKSGIDKVVIEEGLDELEMACWRYDNRHLYHEETSGDDQKAAARRLLRAIEAAIHELEDVDKQLRKRIAHELGYEENESEPSRRRSRAWWAYIRRLFDRGEHVSSVCLRALRMLRNAVEAAASRESWRPRKYRQDVQCRSPHEEAALVHELADVWCEITGRRFQAPHISVFSYELTVRPDHQSAKFVETVLRKMPGKFPDSLSIPFLFKEVRKRRDQEARRSTKEERSKRERSGGGSSLPRYAPTH